MIKAVAPTDQIPELVFFDCPEAELKKVGVASALQSFETAITLIAISRWPSIIILLWGACESILREKYSERPNERAEILQDCFKSDNSALSSSLHREAHKFRKLRNELAHKGFTPKDTERCIKSFFDPGVPYLRCLLKDVANIDLLDALCPEIASFYSGTREVYFRKIRKENPDVSNSTTMLRVFLRDLLSPTYIPAALRELLDDDRGLLQDLRFEFRRTLTRFKSENLGDCCELPGKGCPICGVTPLAWIVWKEEDGNIVFDKLDAVACYKCGYIIDDEDTIEVFFQSRLTAQDFNIINSKDFKSVL